MIIAVEYKNIYYGRYLLSKCSLQLLFRVSTKRLHHVPGSHIHTYTYIFDRMCMSILYQLSSCVVLTSYIVYKLMNTLYNMWCTTNPRHEIETHTYLHMYQTNYWLFFPLVCHAHFFLNFPHQTVLERFRTCICSLLP